MSEVFQSGADAASVRIVGHLARPPADRVARGRPGLVLCHDFSAGEREATTSAVASYPELADRIAAEVGWTVLTFEFRGTGASSGSFSLGGWLTDLRAATDHLLATDEVGGVWLAGVATGGSLAICAGGEDERVRGVATMSARTDFDDWAEAPARFLEHCRSLGMIRDRAYPYDQGAWARELREIRPLHLAGKFSPRPLLLVHGAEDDQVPVTDARALADCHGSAELRVIHGAAHRLRDDPRAVAVFLGWLERQVTPPLE